VAFTVETKRKQHFDFMRCLYDKTEGSDLGLIYIEELAGAMHLPEPEAESIALYLVDEGLIRIRMGHIICITPLGIAEVETALAQPDKPTEHFPALQTTPGRPESAVNQPADDLAAMELRRICEAIGLDPKEFAGEAAPPKSNPVEAHDPSNDVSDDVRKLIEQLHPGGAPGFAFHPNGGEAPDEPTIPPLDRTRATSLKLAHRESAQIPPSPESDLADILTSLKLRLLKIRLDPVDMAEAEAEITTAVAQLLSPRPKPQIITVSLRTLLSILQKAGAAALTSDVELSIAQLRAYLSRLSV
jgi:hypothetical protein